MAGYGGTRGGDRPQIAYGRPSGKCAGSFPAGVVVLARGGLLPVANRSRVSRELGASTGLLYASRKTDGPAVRGGQYSVREREVASRLLLKADASSEPRPTLMTLGGGDSLAEELYFWGAGAAALERGYNALLFEIPGQRGAIYSNPGTELFYRPDTEAPLKYVCDWILARADVDPKRLALAGWSMGGNFAPRAAAFEKRIKACIASTTTPNMQNSILEMLGLPGDQPYPRDLESKLDLSPVGHRFLVAKGDIRYRMGMSGGTIAEFIDGLGKYSLWGLGGQDHVPVFLYWRTRRGPTGC
jgi:hypothetical protein